MKTWDLVDHFGKRGNYKEPKKEEIEALKELVDVLFSENKNVSGMNNFSEPLKKLKLKIVELEDRPNNYALFGNSVGPLFFIWNFNGSDTGSCLVYTHAGSDSINNFVVGQYISGNHKCLVINGMSIASTKKKSLTQNSKTKCNVDHSYDNLMNYLINFLNLRSPNLVFINCHGMATDPNRDLWIINSMTNYDYTIKNYPVLLLIAFLLYFPKIKIQTSVCLDRFTINDKFIKLQGFEKYGPTSSVIGKIIHSSSMDSKDPIKDNGLYVHCEHGISFANNINNSNDVASAHKIALKYFRAWDNDKHSLVKAPRELEKFEEWLFNKVPKTSPQDKHNPDLQIQTHEDTLKNHLKNNECMFL